MSCAHRTLVITRSSSEVKIVIDVASPRAPHDHRKVAWAPPNANPRGEGSRLQRWWLKSA